MDIFVFLISLVFLVRVTNGYPDARRLYDDLLARSGYTKLARPVYNFSTALKVHFGLSLAQLIDVSWRDVWLQWNPKEYGNVTELYVPSTAIFLPDVVLNNNVDGAYTVTIMTKALLKYDGTIKWNPPAIYKSHCDINVEYFPFDNQLCNMIFLPWSYNGLGIDMVHRLRELYVHDHENFSANAEIPNAIDMSDYVPSTEWDIISVPAIRSITHYPCCPEPYPLITFSITIRRKTEFYTVNIILPCVCINLLTLTGFYVPCDCGEKISICITVLLSLSMFQLLLFDLVPATSLTVPLLGKYILFTMFVCTGSIVCSVLVLSVKNSTNVAGEMPQKLKYIFNEVLARLLFMPRPTEKEQEEELKAKGGWSSESNSTNIFNPYAGGHEPRTNGHGHHGNCHESLLNGQLPPSSFIGFDKPNLNDYDYCDACTQASMAKHPLNVQKAIEGVGYIAKHHQENADTRKLEQDWIYMAMVIDRFLLWVYVSLSFLCTFAVLLNAPSLYDTRPGLTRTSRAVSSVP